MVEPAVFEILFFRPRKNVTPDIVGPTVCNIYTIDRPVKMIVGQKEHPFVDQQSPETARRREVSSKQWPSWGAF